MKPTVQYYKNLWHGISLGGRAIVYPVDHPNIENVSNEKYVTTSKVISYNPVTGEFETLNTKYVPKE